ncbi:ABC transporter ATP-binding protein [Natrialba swarupiae]|uniref:ABC-type D-xylose/L-arabinose transporter n=1 Tax=Natrialba swarupiae TaxID=2448032 RepID=A0A5D5AJZ0_9EURY|nr:ABC transporter ATP-binding protein [Natrialba swarupiae]TYT61494.1 ABC transporter ATP-binding protein [Natrialba swarupiae]
MTSIELDSVNKIYDSEGGEICAVNDMDLEIQEGEFLVFVGPSGCGKTTTLRMIAGLEDVTTGTIEFGDEDVTDLRARDRDIAMVFQDYALYPHMSVRDNIGFGLRLSTDIPESEIASMVEETAEMLGIEDLLPKKPSDLSGGQQQRVALGRAIIREPSVFLLDEPLSNLDAKLRDSMRKEIMELQQQLGITSVYVTHDQTEAMAMSDRVAVLNDGELQQCGPPEDVYRNPTNQFVAGFLGSPSMNFLEATVSSDGDTVTFNGDADFVYHSEASSIAEALGDRNRCTVGIRPEDLVVGAESGFNVTVTVVEAMGDENVVYAQVGDAEIRARVDSQHRLSAGDDILLGFDDDNVYLFDAETGDSLRTKDLDSAEETEKRITSPER